MLILGSDTPLGTALTGSLQRLNRHEVKALTRSATRWKNERQAKKVIRRVDADIVVDLRIEAEADGGEPIHDLDLKRCQWVAKACQRGKSAYFFVSSSRVFSGELDRPYHENDEPDSQDELGELLAAAEAVVREHCQRHLILRLGPVFSDEGSNLVRICCVT